MEAEHIINLIDDFWFTEEFFKKPYSSIPDHKKPSSELFSSQILDKPSSSNQIIQDSSEFSSKSSETPSSSNHKTIFSDHHITQDSSMFSSQMSMHSRSKSEETMSIVNSSCPLSPNSVLPDQPHLDTILSGKEGLSKAKRGENSKKKKVNKEKRAKGLSKSLSELEFEELKGFMDLGFVFSEEDRSDSVLVSILPGLQRLGKKGNNDHDEESCLSTRPYLSEAWNRRPVINWRVPSASNEIGMKDSLKSWAHIVASSVIR